MKKVITLMLTATCAVAQQTATVTIHTDKILHKVAEREFHGVNLVALWNGDDDVISDESLQMYKQLGMGLLRFPGGAPAQWYDWETPLASGWTKLTPANVAEFAKKGGSRMVFQTNAATDSTTNKDGREYSFNSSGEHAANWVKAMKKAGIDVAFWEIGNEPEMDAPGHIKGNDARVYEWYNAKYKEQAEAIKKADPKARVMGPSATNAWFWWHENNLAKFLKAHGNKAGSGLADVISLHWYPEGNKDSWQKKRGVVQKTWPKAMEHIKNVLKENDTRDLPLYITEWNWGGGMDNQSSMEYANAMGVADTVGMFMRTGVAGHTFFCYKKIKTNWGVVATKNDGRPVNEGAPAYYALALTALLGGDVLETATTSDEADVMSVYATRNAARITSILLINKTEEAIQVALEWKGAARPMGAGVRIHTLEGESPTARDVTFNGVKSPEPWKATLPPPVNLKMENMTKITVAPYSVNVLQVK